LERVDLGLVGLARAKGLTCHDEIHKLFGLQEAGVVDIQEFEEQLNLLLADG
jgi:hypothetical protein